MKVKIALTSCSCFMLVASKGHITYLPLLFTIFKKDLYLPFITSSSHWLWESIQTNLSSSLTSAGSCSLSISEEKREGCCVFINSRKEKKKWVGHHFGEYREIRRGTMTPMLNRHRHWYVIYNKIPRCVLPTSIKGYRVPCLLLWFSLCGIRHHHCY